MANHNQCIPSVSSIKSHIFFASDIKLLSAISFELCKIIQNNPGKRITLSDKNYTGSKIRIPRKIVTIIHDKMSVVNW